MDRSFRRCHVSRLFPSASVKVHRPQLYSRTGRISVVNISNLDNNSVSLPGYSAKSSISGIDTVLDVTATAQETSN